MKSSASLLLLFLPIFVRLSQSPTLLDHAFGFHGVRLETGFASNPGLQVTEDQSSRGVPCQTAIRPGEKSEILGLNMHRIEYIFFEDKLAEIKMSWSEIGPKALRHVRSFQKELEQLYGGPTAHKRNRVPVEVGWKIHFGEGRTWVGHRVVMEEGIEWGRRGEPKRPDFDKGYLVIYSKDLMVKLDAANARAQETSSTNLGSSKQGAQRRSPSFFGLRCSRSSCPYLRSSSWLRPSEGGG